MGGKPAARQGDMTRKGLDIVQGSAGVLIGAPTGVACSVCPGGITYANPVNPLLGAKVLPGETDLALPGPLPFILSRAYSSYRTRTPAPVGVFGPGWKAPFDIRLQIRDEGLILNDSGGRSIHFEPLFPGEISYSRSESLWLARGGVAAQHSSQPLSALWQVLPEDVRLSPHVYLATNSLQGPWWILSWPERVPGADEVLPPEPPAYRVLTGVVDGFGRTLAFHRAAEGDVAGAVTGVTDGAGRRFHLVLTTQAQRAEVFRKQRATSLSSPAGPRSASSSLVFPDTLPAGTGYGTDNGIRLEAVWLTHDPAYPDEQPTAPLARYTYTAGGELRAVYDRSGTQVRGFTYDAEHAGRMVAHHYAGRPESCYRYDDTGRVTEQVNPEGLDYRFEYGESRVIITDSQSTFRYDPVDRLTEQRGFDGRTQRYHYDLTGKLTQSEDEGLITLWHYDASDRITHRTVNGDPAEQWQYDEHGWLTTLSHTCEGHRVSVHYGYDDKGRLTGERQTVENPETGEMLWEHETGHAYSEQGLATRQEPDGLPPVEWLTYGSGYLAGMKLGGTPLVEYTRDRLHRETARSFGGAGSTAGYEQATAYTLTGQLQSRHLNLPQLDCDYTWNDNGQLVRISGPQECREYRYSGTGRLTGVHTTAANLDIDIPYATDPAGNRLPDPELHPDSTLTAWPDNRIAEDAHYVYRYDEYGRLAEKTDRIPEGVIRMHDERTHHYHYDSQHRLVFYTRIQHGEPQVESRYLYDPLGRRTGKRVWRRERDLTGWMSLSRKPEETWYGWDGDRLTTVQTQQTRIQTVYQPGSFTPLLRIETENGEQAKARHRSLAEVLQEDTGVTLPAELAVMLGRLERELRQGSVSEESQQWLAQCGLTAEQMAAQLEAEYIPERKLHLYHCDHRGLPLALISPEGETAWQGEYDEWGNLLGEESAQHLQQSLRLPGQQYDEESGLYYNRNRYYDPLQGRYITQDPIGLRGEWNLYKYPLNPVRFIDSLGLKFHVNGDPSDFNQAVEYLKQDSQMKETIDFLSSSEETINIEYIEGTNVRFNSNNMAIYWNSRASLFCSTELNSKSQSPALGLGHEFAHAQYYLLDKENFMALLSRTDKKYENKEEARVITIIESRAAKTLGECTRGANSGLPFYRVDGPLQTMKITGTPE
ncbi:RHS repeat protein [Escherichia coli]|nr:RHS repeat protein [Escherichia coli]MCD4034967.1 RHS repeat protein [Escherichia coli]MCD4210901.1 RHS repeat protein [Escherichia coli]MCD4216199.1 RHS repeat protein [Escherichia coli]MCD4302403.1 RHS repeat protein [Escherichia coli]